MHAWIGKLCQRVFFRSAPRRRPRGASLQVECLEARCTPTLTILASLLDGPEGINPYGTPLVDSSGNLFGTTFGGNPSGFGTVYEVNPFTGSITTLAVFTGPNGAHPEGGLVEDSHGNLFGTTSAGGPSGEGTIFEITSGGTLKTLFSFNGTDGANPSNETLLLDPAGNLFGTTRNGGLGYNGGQTGDGTVFELPQGSSTITTLAFDGSDGSLPFAGLIEDTNGDLFGTTSSGGPTSQGTLFEIQAGTNNIGTLASFSGNNGAAPECTLLLDSSGNLLGTTTTGGTSNFGTLFELPAGSSTLQVLASFSGSLNGAFPRAGVVEDSAGNLFGTALYGGMNFNVSQPQSGTGTLFEFAANSSTLITVATFTGGADGANPSAGLFQDSSGNLFGAAVAGGPGGLHYGTVFMLPSGTASIVPLAAFPGSDGAAPFGALVQDSAGNLFGGAVQGGQFGDGTLFELPQGSSTIQLLATFNGANGTSPEGNIVADSRGDLFGTTIYGGGSGYGTVFELPQGSNTIQTLVSFNGPGGAYPVGGLMIDSMGNLFGTTYAGGGFGGGMIFEVLAGSGTLLSLAPLPTNSQSRAGLVEDSNGNLFGVTSAGGPSGYGTVFELPGGSGTVQILASFNGANGATPDATLILDTSGNLFGTTFNGGASAVGTVFEVKQGSGTITDLASFSGSNGANPYGGLVEAGDMLFGTTPYGGLNYFGPQTGLGTAYELSSSGGMITTIGIFSESNGAQPGGTLLEDSHGDLIGPAVGGGAAGFGTVFELVGAAGPGITTTTLPNWTINQTGYSQTIAAAGGTGSLSFAASGTLPPGLTLSSAGVLAGTPTALGSYTFTVTVTDSSGHTGSASYTVIIYAPPAVLTLTAPSTTSAGTPITLSITALDAMGNTAGAYDGTVTLSSSLGADVSVTSVTLNAGTATVLVVVTGAGTQTLTVSAAGLTSGMATITVSPGPFTEFGVQVVGQPQVGAAFLVTVQAEDRFGNAVSSYTGAASVTPTLGPPGASGNYPSAVPINSHGLGLFLVTMPKTGNYTMLVAGGAVSSNKAAFTVAPGPPATLVFGVQPVNTPTGDKLPAVTVQVEDSYGDLITTDNTDTVILGVASGPGALTPGSTTTATVHNGIATFNNLTLTVPGSYSLSAVVPSLFTGPNSAPFTVLPLQVVPGTFAGTPSGFSLEFNAPFLVNATTPVLYGPSTPTSPVPAPSVIVTTDPGNLDDRAAYVAGSLVVHPAFHTLMFVATNTTLEANTNAPILPDGIYTVIVRGSAGNNGFQALNSGGGYLDGKSMGTAGSGDYIATFTVGAAAAKDDVVWVPPTADGPGQALNGPGLNQLGSGYPLYLDDSTGSVTSVQLSLSYDPTLLTVTGVKGAGFSLSSTSTAGHAVLQYSGPALPTGSQTLIGYLTATVPGGTVASPMPYKAEDLLDFASVSLNQGAIPVVISAGLHVVSYVGDADGNGTYTSADAVLITRVTLQTDSGFAAYPLLDPTVVADTDGSGFVPSDAPLQVNEAGVGARTANLAIPPLPSGVHFQALIHNVSLPQHAPDALHVAARSTSVSAFHANVMATFGVPDEMLDDIFGSLAPGRCGRKGSNSVRHASSG